MSHHKNKRNTRRARRKREKLQASQIRRGVIQSHNYWEEAISFAGDVRSIGITGSQGTPNATGVAGVTGSSGTGPSIEAAIRRWQALMETRQAQSIIQISQWNLLRRTAEPEETVEQKARKQHALKYL